MRGQWPIRFAPQLTNQNVSAPSGRAARLSTRARLVRELATRKAVGEAFSFPYRLITNPFYFRCRPKGEEAVLAVGAVSEFDAVPRLPLPLPLPWPSVWL